MFLVTADKDFAQLVRKKWGVPPEQIPDLLALVGDKIDNIPGVAGQVSAGGQIVDCRRPGLDELAEGAESTRRANSKKLKGLETCRSM